MEFRELRKQLGMTQSQMAKKLGITRSYYGEIEKGREASATLVNMRDMLERSLLLESRLCELSQNVDRRMPTESVSSGAKAVEEFLAKYGDKHVDTRASDSSVIFDPKWREGDSRPPAVVTLQDVVEHLQPWFQAAEKDPNIPPVMYRALRKVLPHSDLEEPE